MVHHMFPPIKMTLLVPNRQLHLIKSLKLLPVVSLQLAAETLLAQHELGTLRKFIKIHVNDMLLMQNELSNYPCSLKWTILPGIEMQASCSPSRTLRAKIRNSWKLKP